MIEHRPVDFLRFWSSTRAELEAVDPALRLESTTWVQPGLALEDLSFSSLGGVRVRGYALRWHDDRGRPLVVHGHGYRDRSVPRTDWAARGLHVVGVDFRGFGRSAAAVSAPSPWGWLLTGIESPETCVLRGAVCDYARTVEVARTLTDHSTTRVVLHGQSLAGALALMAEALMPAADLLVLATPTFGWAEGRRLLVERGSGAEINRFLARHPDVPEEDLMVALRYFDAVNFAPLVRCPAVVGVGLRDRVVPFPTVRPIIEGLGGPVELMEFPVSHESGPQMREWDRFDRRWLEMAVEGLRGLRTRPRRYESR